MKVSRYLALLGAVAVAGCAASGATQDSSAISKAKALEDYIEVGQLEELALIRTRDQIHYKVVSEKHIIIYDRKKSYLATFRRACRELKETHVTPDIRHDRNTIRARFDTIRGCRIESLYALDDGQAEELIQLGEGPGG